MNTELPLAFAERIKAQFSERAEPLLKALAEGTPAVSVLLNSRKTLPGDVVGTPVPWHPLGRLLSARPNFALDPLWHAGAYYVQESSSMFLGHVLGQCGVPTDGAVLDLCAAPGGKSRVISEYMSSNGLVVSNEIHPLRAAILRENILKQGRANSVVTRCTPMELAQLGPAFDAVVVDAPCSGEGMFRKDPDARSEWNPGLPAMCASRQLEILEHAGELVKPGGALIYSTCTFAPEENENVIRHAEQEWGWEPIETEAPEEWPLERVAPNAFRFGPHISPGEGFFIAALRVPGSRQTTGKRKPAPALTRVSAPDIAMPSDILHEAVCYAHHRQPLIRACSGRWFDFMNRLHSTARVILDPLEVGEPKGRDVIPAHHLAMCALPNAGATELTLSEALDFLRKNEIRRDMPLGWQTVAYKGRTLGWVKHLGNRSNNGYPKEFRLRMK